jgi:hypothetical protein
MMTIIHLRGKITEKGELDVQLPSDLPTGEVTIHIEYDVPRQTETWTEEELEELKELLKPDPKTGAEIVALGLTGTWADLDIVDSVEWVEELRRKRKERRNIQW